MGKLIYEIRNKKSMKFNKSLGGIIARLEAGSSQNYVTSHKLRLCNTLWYIWRVANWSDIWFTKIKVSLDQRVRPNYN